MSYCRMGVDGSEVYAYQDCAGYCVVWHEGKSTKVRGGLPKLRTFLSALRKRGLSIPEYAFEGIDYDIAEDNTAAVARAMST